MKNYNPFRLWGSYLGIVISILLNGGYSISRIQGYDLLSKIFVAPLIPISWLYNIILNLNVSAYIINPLAWFVVIIYGFLVGWIIHSLVRALRR